MLSLLRAWSAPTLFIFSLLGTPTASAIWSSPSCNSYVSTIGTLFLQPRRDPHNNPIVPLHEMNISFYPERNQFMGWFQKAEAKVLFSKGKTNAPIIYLLNGLGSSAKSTYSVYLMDRLNDLGFTVVSIPSTFNETATLGFSTHVRPGLSSQDLPDIMRLIDAVSLQLAQKHKMNPPAHYLMGVSMGAFHTAAVLSRPELEQKFKKFVLINPPLDLRYGIRVLDEMVDGANRLPASRQEVLQEIAQTEEADEALQKMENQNVGSRDLGYLIGSAMRSSVQGTVLSSQKYINDGVLKSTSSFGRKQEVKKWSIQKYFDLVALPFFQKMYDKAGEYLDLDYELSIWPHLAHAPNPSKVLMLHSMDDFISHPEELKKLPLLENETVLTKCGGHVGALGYSLFMNPLKEFLTSP